MARRKPAPLPKTIKVLIPVVVDHHEKHLTVYSAERDYRLDRKHKFECQVDKTKKERDLTALDLLDYGGGFSPTHIASHVVWVEAEILVPQAQHEKRVKGKVVK